MASASCPAASLLDIAETRRIPAETFQNGNLFAGFTRIIWKGSVPVEEYPRQSHVGAVTFPVT